MLAINMRADLTGMQRALTALGGTQVPFASALALTRLAQGVAVQEQRAVDQTFDSPTPFTVNSFVVRAARKTNLVSVVAIKPIAASYLRPYIEGGNRSLISRKGVKQGMIVPMGAPVDQYGNLPRNALQRLKRNKDIYIGALASANGQRISGVWQWAPLAKGAKLVGKNGQPPKARPGMKLLVRFEDTTQAPKHLPFYERARAYVKANAAREFDLALRKALATARR
ncbi:MAG TPA: hypothetical protein VFF98_17205 [Novosphingobium sp.]|nr:hypothetical protein [Novosphingobium sp.]